MRFLRRALLSVGWALLLLVPPKRVAGQVAARSVLRTPASGQWADGVAVYTAPAGTSAEVLREMAGRAAVIFVGTVTAVQRPGDETMRGAAGAAVVEIDFAVEQAVRGVATGTTYAMREWAGLWRDTARFTVGQHLLMLLHGAGPGGLSSPVDGLDGAIPVRGGGVAGSPVAADTGVKARVAGRVGERSEESMADGVVDLRWLQAKTLRAMSPSGYADGAAAADAPGALASGMDASAADGLAHVLGLLAVWQRAASVSQ